MGSSAPARLSPLAPLHNPAGILGIEAARKVFRQHSHSRVPRHRFPASVRERLIYAAIPCRYYEKYGVLLFHGTSHKYVAHKAAGYLEEPIERLEADHLPSGQRFFHCHDRSGQGGGYLRKHDPLAGLMMGTRCGDFSRIPPVVNYLKYTLNITGHELDEILNKSGLLGISGHFPATSVTWKRLPRPATSAPAGF